MTIEIVKKVFDNIYAIVENLRNNVAYDEERITEVDLAEIYEKKNNNLKAENEYSTGLKIITNIYDNRSDAKTDDLSYFYTKLAIISVKLQKLEEALKHLRTHRQIFCKKHPRSLQLMEYFGDNKVDVGM